LNPEVQIGVGWDKAEVIRELLRSRRHPATR
jgi:hypothetical protein